jgi:hypothetical protein
VLHEKGLVIAMVAGPFPSVSSLEGVAWGSRSNQFLGKGTPGERVLPVGASSLG